LGITTICCNRNHFWRLPFETTVIPMVDVWFWWLTQAKKLRKSLVVSLISDEHKTQEAFIPMPCGPKNICWFLKIGVPQIIP
jgi:hypothetical protein